FASGEDGLCPSEPIAGGFGNPLRVPITTVRVGGGRALPVRAHRGRVWEPSQGSHHYRSRRGRTGFARPSPSREGLGTLSGFPSLPFASGEDGLCPSEPIAGGFGNPLRVPITTVRVGGGRALPVRAHRGRVWE